MTSCGHEAEAVFFHPITRELWRLCRECPTDRSVGYARFFEATS